MALSSFIHAAGNVLAPAAEATGAALSLGGLVPNKAAALATNTGHAISNPNVTLSNAGAILTPGVGSFSSAPSYQSAGSVPSQQPQAQPAGQNSGAYDPQAATAASQAAQDRSNALFGIDSGLTSANDAMGRLGQQEQIGNGNIDNEYQAAIDQLMGSNQDAQRNYDTSRTGQVNDYIAKQASNESAGRTWLDSARRTLGAQGAGSGSAARYNLPYDAQQQVAQGNATAQATNNKNLIALDTNWAETEDKFKNANADVERQRTQGRNDLQSKIAEQKATLVSTIAQLMGQRTIANGGDYKAAAAAAAPYTSQIPGLQDKITALSAMPHIQAQQVTTTAPTLEQYNYARPQAAPTPTQDPTLSNPVLAAILGSGQQDQKQLQFA